MPPTSLRASLDGARGPRESLVAVANSVIAHAVPRTIINAGLGSAGVAAPAVLTVALKLVRADTVSAAQAVVPDTHLLGTNLTGPAFLAFAGTIPANTVT